VSDLQQMSVAAESASRNGIPAGLASVGVARETGLARDSGSRGAVALIGGAAGLVSRRGLAFARRPAPNVTVLPSGLEVATVYAPTGTAALTLSIRAGSRFEDAGTSGLSHMVEHMLFRHRHTAALDQGGLYAGATGREDVTLSLACQPQDLPELVRLLGKVWRAPDFAGLARERSVVEHEIREDYDGSGRLVDPFDLLSARHFKDHPLGQPIAGTVIGVRRFKVADVSRWFSSYGGMANARISVAGPVDDHDKIAALVGASFFGCSPGARRVPLPAPPPSGPVLQIVPGSEPLCDLLVSFRTDGMLDPDRLALQQLAMLLDGGAITSRLRRRLGSEKGLAYSMETGIEELSDCGTFTLAAKVRPATLPAALREVRAQLEGLRDVAPSQEELDGAIRRTAFDRLRGYDSAQILAAEHGPDSLYRQRPTTDEVVAGLREMTPNAIVEAARKLFKPSGLVIVATQVPGARIGAQLEQEARAFAR